MQRILVADNDPIFLAALRAALDGRVQGWQMLFAADAKTATAALRGGPFDAVVAGLRVREPGGRSLLEVVRQEQPATVRIGLGTKSDGAAVVEALDAAHRVITKPCAPELVAGGVLRAFALQRRLEDPALRGFVAGLSGLPPVPHVYAQLSAAMADPDASLPMIGRIVEQDPAIVAKLLQVANSAAVGARERVATVERAVILLGLETLRTLTLSTQLMMLAERAPVPGFSLVRMQEHALLSARIARRLSSGAQAQQAFTAALLADAGKLVLAICVPARFAEVVRACKAGTPVLEAERSVFGFTHAEVGAYVLGLWGLPSTIVEAVAFHHTPGESRPRTLDTLAAVHAAAVLADELGPPLAGVTVPAAAIDASLVDAGLATALPDWRRLAKEEHGRH
jgi:HD-like signal output (HDOD) protein/ActR/RegA family two-component response regulator